MIAESITIQVLHIISLALTPIEQWETARRLFKISWAAETCLTGVAGVALIIAVILVFRESTKHSHSEHRLKQMNVELTATNEKLRQEIVELYRKQVEVLEKIIGAEQPRKEIPSLKPSRN
jgi:hypothetical protein